MLRTTGSCGWRRAYRFRSITAIQPLRYISQQDISKTPSLNQFQDPNKPPPQSVIPPSFKPPNVPPPPIPSKPRSNMTSILTICAMAGLIYWGIRVYEDYEDTTYSNEFGKVLSDALVAENEGDFAKALKLYRKCLVVCDNEMTSELDQHYTGAVLKVAEMFEKLEDFDHALAVYKTLSEFMVSEIGKPDSNLSKKKFDMLLQQTMVAAMRYTNLLKPEERYKVKKLLLDIIVMAQRRLAEHYPAFLVLLYDQINRSIVDFLTAADPRVPKLPNELRSIVKEGLVAQLAPQPGPDMAKLPKEIKLLITAGDAWLPFVKELVSLRDQFADICISEGSLDEASFYLRTNLLLMQSSIDEPGKLTLTLTKMGVVLYLMSEEYDKHAKLLENTDQIAIIDQLSTLGFKPKPDSSHGKFGNVLNRIKETSYKESEASFQQVLELTGMIRSASFGTDTQLPEFVTVGMHLAEMISSTGLAMHMLREKKYAESKKHFLRARVLALKYDVDDYLKDIDFHLEELNSKMP
ncbi:hypothetical protein KL920_005351 [Ogataea angusta]|nr:hypothetical protein KL920_005351 [Ogataea angusta]